MTMRDLFHRRPWLWIVLLLGTMVLANLVLVWVSITHPVVMMK
jgi:hypothetical protein